MSVFDRVQRETVPIEKLADSPATREAILKQAGVTAPIAVSDPAVIQKLRVNMQILSDQAVAVFGDRGSVQEWLTCVKTSISTQNAQAPVPAQKSATGAALVTGLETARQVTKETNSGVAPAVKQEQEVPTPGQR